MQPRTPSEAGTLAEPLLGDDNESLTSSQASFNPDGKDATPHSHATMKLPTGAPFTEGSHSAASAAAAEEGRADNLVYGKSNSALARLSSPVKGPSRKSLLQFIRMQEAGGVESLDDDGDADDDVSKELSFEDLAYIILDKSLVAKYMVRFSLIILLLLASAILSIVSATQFATLLEN